MWGWNKTGRGGAWTTPLVPSQSLAPAHNLAAPPVTRTVHGDNFMPGIKATLGGVPLSGLVWIDEQTVEITVPAGFAFGRHSLKLTNPGGAAAVLPGALLVGWEVVLPLVAK